MENASKLPAEEPCLMKAVANFPEPGEIRVIDVAAPAISAPGDVLIKTVAVGLCGTDKEIAHQDYGWPPHGSDHLIIGHECLGEVVEVGSAVTQFKPGELVVPRVRRPCPVKSCEPCRMGRPDFCLTGEYTERGIVGAPGFMVEQFVDSEEFLHPVPDEIREFAVLTEPLTIAMKSLIQVQAVQDRLPYIDKSKLKSGNLEGMTAVVLGAGPVGMLGALALLNAGASVFVYSRDEKPNDAATIVERAGGQYVSSSSVNAEKLGEITGPVHLMYEATGASLFAFEMVSLLGRNGVYVMTGVPGRKEPVPISVGTIMSNMVLKNQLIIGTVNAGAPAYEAAIRTLCEVNRRWPGLLASMITSVLTPEDVPAALSGDKHGIKQVVTFA